MACDGLPSAAKKFSPFSSASATSPLSSSMHSAICSEPSRPHQAKRIAPQRRRHIASQPLAVRPDEQIVPGIGDIMAIGT